MVNDQQQPRVMFASLWQRHAVMASFGVAYADRILETGGRPLWFEPTELVVTWDWDGRGEREWHWKARATGRAFRKDGSPALRMGRALWSEQWSRGCPGWILATTLACRPDLVAPDALAADVTGPPRLNG